MGLANTHWLVTALRVRPEAETRLTTMDTFHLLPIQGLCLSKLIVSI